jgi:hypothetical protein
MKNESLDWGGKEKEWEQSLYTVPYTNADGLPLEEWTREAGAGLMLCGFRLVEMSDTGNGVETYPYFTIEPNIDEKRRERYLQLLEKKRNIYEGLSEHEQADYEEMQQEILDKREKLQKDAEALLDEYYGERGEDTLEGIERLVVVRNGDAINVIAPIGAPVTSESVPANVKERTEDEVRARAGLFTSEVERFGIFLKKRYLNNDSHSKTHRV